MSRRGLLAAGVLAGVLAASGVPLEARGRGGVLRLAVAGPLPRGREGWDTRGACPRLALACGGVAETLTEWGADGALRPALAAAWEADGAGRDWRLLLDPEARFADGTPVRPQDAIASLERHRHGSPLAWLLRRIERTAPDGAGGLRLVLRESDPDLPLHLADPRLVIWPDGRAEGMGSGLYRPAEQAEGLLRLLRVDGHRRDGAAGFFDAVDIVALPEARDRLAALERGVVHAADLAGPGLVAAARRAGLGLAEAAGPRQLLIEGQGAVEDWPRLWEGEAAAADPFGPCHAALAPEPAPSAAPAGGRPVLHDWSATEDGTLALALAGPWAPRLARDPEGFGALRRGLRAARGAGERAEAWAALRRWLRGEGAPSVALNLPLRVAHDPALGHGPVSGVAPLDGGRLAERWWFAA